MKNYIFVDSDSVFLSLDTLVCGGGGGSLFDIYYWMDCYKSHWNIYFTIFASTQKKKFHIRSEKEWNKTKWK